MLQNLKKRVIFANPLTLKPTMETIILSYEPGSDFAVALEELIRNSEGVYVVKRRASKKAQKAIDAMRQQSELNGNSELSLEEINEEIRQVRLSRKA